MVLKTLSNCRERFPFALFRVPETNLFLGIDDVIKKKKKHANRRKVNWIDEVRSNPITFRVAPIAFDIIQSYNVMYVPCAF